MNRYPDRALHHPKVARRKVARPLACEPLEPRYALHAMAIQWSFYELGHQDLADAWPDITVVTSAVTLTPDAAVALELTELETLAELDALDDLVGEGEAEPDGNLNASRDSTAVPSAKGSQVLSVPQTPGGLLTLPILSGLPLAVPLSKPLSLALENPLVIKLTGPVPSPSSAVLPTHAGISSLLASPTVSAPPVGASIALPLASQHTLSLSADRAAVLSSPRSFASPRSEVPALHNSTISTDVANSSHSHMLVELRAAAESLVKQRPTQRQPGTAKAIENGRAPSLAIEAIARAHREITHDDGLLQLATSPERMSNISSLEPYAAIEQVEAQSRSIQLIKVGMVREFDLAGQHLGSLTLASDPARMVTQVPNEAMAAIDAWHANSVSTQESLETITDGENSVLNRSLLPLSFFAVAGLWLRSRHKYRQTVEPRKARQWRWRAE